MQVKLSFVLAVFLGITYEVHGIPQHSRGEIGGANLREEALRKQFLMNKEPSFQDIANSRGNPDGTIRGLRPQTQKEIDQGLANQSPINQNRIKNRLKPLTLEQLKCLQSIPNLGTGMSPPCPPCVDKLKIPPTGTGIGRCGEDFSDDPIQP